MYDVWQDPDYEFAESKSERLLLAALDYSIHHHVVYVAAKPRARSSRPSPRAQAGPSCTFPSAQLSPVSTQEDSGGARADGYDKREIAKEYLW